MKLDLSVQPKQLELARLLNLTGPTAPVLLGYGGALGGGKSGAARRIMLERRYRHRGTVGTIIRRVYEDLRRNHIDPLFAEYPDLLQHYNKQDKELELPGSGGSKLAFTFAESSIDVMRKFAGPEFFDIFVDQAEQFSEAELLQIKSRARWTGIPTGTCKTALFFNPGGVGMEFLRRVFWIKQYKAQERPTDYAFIQAYGWDNYQWFTHLMSQAEFYALESDARFQLFIAETDYGRSINSMPESLRSGMLLGSFESFVGQYFAGAWDYEKCVITEQQVAEIVQPWWTRWMGQDWGFGDHTCNLWFAAGKMSPKDWMLHFGGHVEWPMDVVVCYREYVVSGQPEADLANEIVLRTTMAERKYMQRFFLSQDAFGQKAKQQGAHSVGEQYANIMRRYGLPAPEPADQERVNGWRFMYNCLRQAHLRGSNVHEERTKQGPAFLISTGCPEVIGNIPLAIRDEDDREDVARIPNVLWEDVTDAVRYGLLSMLRPQARAPRAVREMEVYNQFEDPTAKAMAMRQFAAKETKRPLMRRPRPR